MRDYTRYGPSSKRVQSGTVKWKAPEPEWLGNCPEGVEELVSPDGMGLGYVADETLPVTELPEGQIVASSPLVDWKGGFSGLSPDSRLLDYGSFGADGDAKGLWVLDVTTGKTRQILKGNLTRPRSSPEGTLLACEDPVAGASFISSAEGRHSKMPLAMDLSLVINGSRAGSPD